MNLFKTDDIQQGFFEAQRLTKQNAKTFYVASKFLPPQKRYAAYAIYAVCHLSDDIVDSNNHASKTAALAKLRQHIELAYSGESFRNPLFLAFRETVNSFKIPKKYFDELLEGMGMDLLKNRYASFEELYDYAYKVAGVIGLMMLKVFGDKTAGIEKYAIDLGIALQLTNILRDIKEDFAMGRIYIPYNEMERFGVREEHIAKGSMDENFIALLKFQIQRAQDYYDHSEKGIKLIKNGPSRFVITLIKKMYAGILTAIEKNHYNVFAQKIHVSFLNKISIILKAFF